MTRLEARGLGLELGLDETPLVVTQPTSASSRLIGGDEVQQVLDPSRQEVAEDLAGRHPEDDEQEQGAEHSQAALFSRARSVRVAWVGSREPSACAMCETAMRIL
jgi:hypothetical protein